MSTYPTELVMRTPCCDRKVRAAAFFKDAVEVYLRTCPRCGERWQVVVKPLGRWVFPGGFAHEMTWARRTA